MGRRGLEPRVLVAGVVHHEVGDDAYAAGVRLADELAEVLDGAEFRQHGGVVGDVVAAVTQGRGIEGRQPDAVDTEPLDVVELGDHPLEGAGPRAGRIREGPGEQFVEDGTQAVLVARGEDFCLAAARLPLAASISQVVAARGRLWISVHVVPGSFEAPGALGPR